VGIPRSDVQPNRPDRHEAPAEHGGAPDHRPPGHAPAARLVGATRGFAVIVGPLLVVAALKLGKPVLVPLVAGLFLAVVASPIRRRLRETLPRRLRWLALVAAMLVIIAGVGVFGGALGLSGRAITDELRARRPQIEAQIERARRAADRAGLPMPAGASGEGSPQSASGGEGGGGESGDSGSGVAGRALRTVGAGLGGLMLALAFAALGLAEADEARRRIAHVGRGDGARRALAAIDEALPVLRRYVWVKSLTSAITGLATALAALAFGLPLAWVWGFLAFLLEYVPTVGSILAVVPPTLMALADGGPGKAAGVLATIGTLQVVLGNVVDPRLEGKLMALSPFGVLLSIVFWGWLWGAAGALLAVPLTVVVVIACRHIPGARGVATLLAGDGVPEGPEEGGGGGG
jgi:predicted PurR-regulated permease PerM